MSESTVAGRIQRVGQVLSQLRWLVLLRGILLIVLGGYALYRPGMTLVALTQVLAAFAIIDGMLAIVAGIMGVTESRKWTIARGLLGILAGIFVLANSLLVSLIAGVTIVLVLAFQAIASGVFEIIVAIRERKQIEGEGWLILSGIFGVLFGGILLSAPFASLVTLVWVIGFFAIFFGVVLIVNSFRMRKLGNAMADPGVS